MLAKRTRFVINNLLNSTHIMQKLTFCELAQGRTSFPREEEKIIEYWREIDAFKTQLEKTKDKEPFTFYDGPPFATGKPRMCFYKIFFKK